MKHYNLKPLASLALATILTACSTAPSGDKMKPPADSFAESTSTAAATIADYDHSSLDGILTGICEDFSGTTQLLTDAFQENSLLIGDTYEGYVANKPLVATWYQSILTETDALMQRTVERTVEYLKLVAASIDHTDERRLEKALKEYEDQIYEDVMEDFYENVYEDLLEEAYELYCEDLMEQGYYVDPYETWQGEQAAAYELCTDTAEEFYQLLQDTHTVIYQYVIAVEQGFAQGNFDVDRIIKDCEEELAAESAEAESAATSEAESAETEVDEPSDSKEDEDTHGIRPEFQEAMDSYEAFFDEYVAFMKKYMEADPDDMLGMMDEYTDYLEQYADTMEALSKVESENLSNEELAYWLKVTNRIQVKLLEVGA